MSTITSRTQAALDAFAADYHEAMTTDGEEMSDGEALDLLMESFNKNLLCFMTDTAKRDELIKDYS